MGLQPRQYTVKLAVDGQAYTQSVTIRPDPRNLPGGADPPLEGEEDNL